MGYFFGFELCIAAGDDNKRSGVLPGYLSDCLTTFFIGQFGYRTSIVGRCFIFECMDVYHIQPFVMQNREQRYSFRLKISSHRFLIVVYEGTILQTMLYICRQMHK